MIPTLILFALMGATDPAITQDNIAQNICRPGYARSVRPPASWSRAMRRQMHAQPSQVVDHIIPIEIGGAPRDMANLQLQDRAEALRKDRKENSTHRALCKGIITLDQAQKAFAQ